MRAISLFFAGCLLFPLSAQAGWDEGMAAYQRKDWNAAAREFKPLADTGDVQAMSRLGHMTLHGQGVPKDEAAAFRLLSAAADKGDAAAQNSLGGMYFRGIGTSRDTAQALIWFSRAADQNQPNALNNLGQLYLFGNGIAKDEGKALILLRRAADLGVAASWEAMGIIYWDGRSVPADHAEAVRWYRKAAERGFILAQNRLGSALWNGDGTPKDQTEAVKWFERAAAQGDGASLYNMAQAYQHGMGITKNGETAAFYAILAARYAKASDKDRFELARDKITAGLDASTLQRAESRAKDWAPTPNSREDTTSSPSSPVAPRPVAATPPTPPATPARPQINAGSGVMVNREGIILTNSHVVARCRNIRVNLEGQQPQAATVMLRDENNDMAALKSSLSPAAIARFRDGPALRSGDNVVVVGYPLSSLLSREPNVTAGVISAQAGVKGDKRYYQITAPVQKGNSGGPLADMSGNVVGIVTSKLNAMKIADSTGDLPQNVNFAVKADLARKFLSDGGVTFETATVAAPLSPADVGEIVRKVTVFVECEG